MNEQKLIEMLQWKRPSSSFAAKMFGQHYLEPIFGSPDSHGNYIHIINDEHGNDPNLCFTAHYDTVHRDEGFQDVSVSHGIAYVEDSDCLGADCTTGIWLILGMIEANIPGVYVIHADEEIGCVGSQALIKDNPVWLSFIDAVISFDRYGEDSIITHQMGCRTASDDFAESLADALQMPMQPDPNGSFTDSNEYVHDVSECTNVSVGYQRQHSANETQDLVHAVRLMDALINADWSKLVFKRPRGLNYSDKYWGSYMGSGLSRYRDSDYREEMTARHLLTIINDYPEEVVDWFMSYGVDAEELARELNLELPSNIIYEMTEEAAY